MRLFEVGAVVVSFTSLCPLKFSRAESICNGESNECRLFDAHEWSDVQFEQRVTCEVMFTPGQGTPGEDSGPGWPDSCERNAWRSMHASKKSKRGTDPVAAVREKLIGKTCELEVPGMPGGPQACGRCEKDPYQYGEPQDPWDHVRCIYRGPERPGVERFRAPDDPLYPPGLLAQIDTWARRGDKRTVYVQPRDMCFIVQNPLPSEDEAQVTIGRPIYLTSKQHKGAVKEVFAKRLKDVRGKEISDDLAKKHEQRKQQKQQEQPEPEPEPEPPAYIGSPLECDIFNSDEVKAAVDEAKAKQLKNATLSTVLPSKIDTGVVRYDPKTDQMYCRSELLLGQSTKPIGSVYDMCRTAKKSLGEKFKNALKIHGKTGGKIVGQQLAAGAIGGGIFALTVQGAMALGLGSAAVTAATIVPFVAGMAVGGAVIAVSTYFIKVAIHKRKLKKREAKYGTQLDKEGREFFKRLKDLRLFTPEGEALVGGGHVTGGAVVSDRVSSEQIQQLEKQAATPALDVTAIIEAVKHHFKDHNISLIVDKGDHVEAKKAEEVIEVSTDL